MTHAYSSQTVARTTLGALLLVVAFAAFVAPSYSQAATYAFVNQAGEVNLVVAADPMTAIATAINRAARSGVILLDSLSDTGLVGDKVKGY